MSENGDSTAGRVTRSLRKRLTSIDSDASSRPGTPIVNNLQPIAETATPSKRITRRTSISTPLATPSKAKVRLDTMEVSNSPARRSTRRRSVSMQEQELPVQTKSKEPTIDAVKEEEIAEKTPEHRRVTRSSSKSPLEVNVLQAKLSASKDSAKKSPIEHEDVINLDDSLDSSSQPVATTPPTTHSTKQTKVRIKKEKNIDEMVHASPKLLQFESKNASTHKENDVPEEEIPSKSITEQKTPQSDSKAKQSSTVEANAEQAGSRKSDVEQKQGRKSNVEPIATKLRSSPRMNVSLEKNDPTGETSDTAKAHVEDGSPQKRRSRPENLKNVAFNETVDEDTIKSVYPKTPGLPKSKSYILDSSKDLETESSNKSTEEKSSDKGLEEDEHVETHKQTSKTIENSTLNKIASPMKHNVSALEEQTKESVALNNSTDGRRKSMPDGEKAEVHEYNDTLNVYKLKTKSIESSTPIKVASPKKNTSSVGESGPAKEESGNAEPVTVFPKSWTHSVSGTVNESAKIDSIKSEESMKKQSQEEESLKKTLSFTSQNGSSRKRKVFDDSDDDSDDLLEEDADYDEDMEEEEERNQEKSIFIDDEAMEVPEGEESMDSEERQYLEENEIPVYGESIGSEDSEDNEDDEEDEEDDDGFIVSDSEDIVLAAEESDSNDEIGELGSANKKKKAYKRIMKYSESSNEADNCADVEDKDFRLIMDSSVEGSSIRDAKTDEALEKGTPSQRNSQGDQEDTDKGDKEGDVAVNSPNKSVSSKKTEEIKENRDDPSNSVTVNAEEYGKRRTPSRRKSLYHDEVEKIEDAGRTSKVNTPNKRMSLKNTEDEPNTDKQEEELADEAERQGDVATEANRSINFESKRLSRSERKSLSRSEANKSVQQPASDVEMEDRPTEDGELMNTSNKSRKSFNKSKPDVSQSENDFDEHNEEEFAAEATNTSMNTSRKSLIAMGTPKQNLNVSRKSARMSLKTDSESSTEPTKLDKNTSLNQTRKSLNDIEDVSKGTTRRSMSKSDPENEGGQEVLNVSRKSLTNPKNTKKETLTRNSTEEDNEEEEMQSIHQRFLNKSKLENTFQGYEEGSEQEETLTASAVPSETSGGRSLNSSKRSRKSLNQSLKNDDGGPSQGDEPETIETESKKPERRSVNRHASLKVYSESEEENDQDNENDDEARFSEEEEQPQEYAAEKSTIMEFLGEEVDTSRSPPRSNLNTSRRTSGNDSKLDETFQLEPNTSSAPIHDTLHRSIMRKSLNQSRLLQEAIEENKTASESEEDAPNYSDNLVDSSEEEQVVVKKALPERGLSVSLSNIEFKKKTMKDGDKAIRNSFTIGVSVRNSSSAHKSPSSPSSTPNECGESDEHVLSEQEDLENVKNVHSVNPPKQRKSLSTSLVRYSPLISEDSKEQKRIKRTSLYLQEESASQSFVEDITKEKQKTDSKRKRHSNSFCGVLAPSVDEHQHEREAPKSERKPKQSSESESKINIQRILSRCDEILEAANLAKREAKLHSKKSKVKKPKWMDKEEKTHKEENEVKIPLVSRKELKRKEKIKKELAKAIKHSTAMLKIIDPKLGKELKATQPADVEETSNKPSSKKRLPTEFLEALDVPPPKQKKIKEIQLTPPSDKENSKKSSNKGTYSKSDHAAEKKKKKRDIEILKTASGTVIVEPSTPKKLRFQHGFRESPKTPVGFKIQDIHSAGQSEREKSRKHAKKLFTPSGEFIEEDLSISNPKTNSKKVEKALKRKRHIEEPVYSLPKTQWTPSGMFVEEDLHASRPLANSTATQFMVSALNGGKKTKNSSSVVSLATLNKAMSFKQSALNDKVRRETSRELIHRKQRKLANKQY